MIKSAEGSAGFVHKTTKPTMWRGGVQILKKEEEDTRLLDRCEAKRKEWAENEELKKSALPRLKECDLEKASGLYRAKSGVV